MSDNLAHKLNNPNLGIFNRLRPIDNNFSNSNSQGLSLDRLKYQATKPRPITKIEVPAGKGIGGSTAQQLDRAKNAASKALSGDLAGVTEEGAGVATQIGSQWLLTVLWGSVWLDWTLLSLLGLNTILVGSILLPNYVCQFGDDYLIGKWLPDRDLAKWTEIIILMIINVIILSIIIIFIYIIYGITQLGWWDYLKIGSSYVTGGSGAAADTAVKVINQ